MSGPLTQAITLFTIAAIGTVAFGVYITLIADELAERTKLGRAVVGAIFLGAQTWNTQRPPPQT